MTMTLKLSHTGNKIQNTKTGGGAENAGVVNAGVDSRGIATEELSR